MESGVGEGPPQIEIGWADPERVRLSSSELPFLQLTSC